MYSFAQEGSEHQRYAGAIDVYYDLNVKQSLMQAGYYMVCSTFLCAATTLLASPELAVVHKAGWLAKQAKAKRVCFRLRWCVLLGAAAARRTCCRCLVYN